MLRLAGRGELGQPRVERIGLPRLHDDRIVFELQTQHIVARQEFGERAPRVWSP